MALRFDMGNPNWQAMAMQQQGGATAKQLGSDLASLGGLLGKTLHRKLGPAQRAFDAENKRLIAAGESPLTTEDYDAFKAKFRAGKKDERLLKRAKKLGLTEQSQSYQDWKNQFTDEYEGEEDDEMGGGGADDPTALSDDEMAGQSSTLLNYLKSDEGQRTFGNLKYQRGQERADKFIKGAGNVLGAPFALAGGLGKAAVGGAKKVANPIMDVVNKAQDRIQMDRNLAAANKASRGTTDYRTDKQITADNLRAANEQSRGGLGSFTNTFGQSSLPAPTHNVPQFTGNFAAGGGPYHNAPPVNVGILNQLMNQNQQVPPVNIGMMGNQAARDKMNLSNQYVNNPPIMTNQAGLPVLPWNMYQNLGDD